METQGVTATDLRVHFKDLANQIADGGAPAVISRHGFKMVALISYEDFLLLQQIKRERQPAETQQRVVLENPDDLTREQLEHLYRVTAGTTDSRTLSWRFKAYHTLRGWKSPLADDPQSWYTSPAAKDPPS